MSPARIVTAILLALLLQGPALSDELGESYYPLKEGMRWEYRVTSDKGGTKKLVITNLRPREVQERTVIPRKWEMDGTTFYYLMAKDEGGIYRFAEQTSENAAPTVISPKEYEIRFPVAEGTTWDITAKLGDGKVTVSLTMESVTDTVTVPAGTFKNCVKIRQVGEDKGNAAVTAYEWHAPKVGVVKSLVTLKLKSKGGAMASESLTYQLQSFKP